MIDPTATMDMGAGVVPEVGEPGGTPTGAQDWDSIFYDPGTGGPWLPDYGQGLGVLLPPNRGTVTPTTPVVTPPDGPGTNYEPPASEPPASAGPSPWLFVLLAAGVIFAATRK